jgi:phenylpropionate dioxygenase-like ring-hydroxylating dioxygenase large terminal subunit
MAASRFIHEDWDARIFRVNRDAYRDPDVFARERDVLWGSGWLYLGHATEVPNPGDYKVRTLGGRELILLRDRNGTVRAFLNACPHRGNALCRDDEGNTQYIRCFYHAWSFDTEGRLVSLPGPDAYPPDSGFKDRLGMRPVAQLDTLRDFVFVSFDPEAPPLPDYLGAAAEYFELVADHSAAGMRVLPGTQNYLARANWKLLVENAMDGYHFAPSHSTFLDYLKSTGYTTSDAGGHGKMLAGGHVVGLQNGHGGRIGLDWEPRFGEAERLRIEQNRTELFARVGPERATLIADWSRTLFMFPNLLLFDIEGISIRQLEPVAPDRTEVRAWMLAPADEPAEPTDLRIKTLVSFIGPGGLATPDDLEAQESVQRAIGSTAGDLRTGVDWNDVSRGMDAERNGGPIRTVDEGRVRHFWRTWDARVGSPS